MPLRDTAYWRCVVSQNTLVGQYQLACIAEQNAYEAESCFVGGSKPDTSAAASLGGTPEGLDIVSSGYRILGVVSNELTYHQKLGYPVYPLWTPRREAIQFDETLLYKTYAPYHWTIY